MLVNWIQHCNVSKEWTCFCKIGSPPIVSINILEAEVSIAVTTI